MASLESADIVEHLVKVEHLDTLVRVVIVAGLDFLVFLVNLVYQVIVVYRAIVASVGSQVGVDFLVYQDLAVGAVNQARVELQDIQESQDLVVGQVGVVRVELADILVIQVHQDTVVSQVIQVGLASLV